MLLQIMTSLLVGCMIGRYQDCEEAEDKNTSTVRGLGDAGKTDADGNETKDVRILFWSRCWNWGVCTQWHWCTLCEDAPFNVVLFLSALAEDGSGHDLFRVGIFPAKSCHMVEWQILVGHFFPSFSCFYVRMMLRTAVFAGAVGLSMVCI